MLNFLRARFFVAPIQAIAMFANSCADRETGSKPERSGLFSNHLRCHGVTRHEQGLHCRPS